MSDNVRGVVTNILGEDIFEIKVLDAGKFNENDYKPSECIRIAGINDPEIYPGKNKAGRIKKLQNREVRCFIIASDGNGTPVAVVQCIN